MSVDYALAREHTPQPLTIAIEGTGLFALKLGWRRAVVPDESAHLLLRHFEEVVLELIEDESRPIGDLPFAGTGSWPQSQPGGLMAAAALGSADLDEIRESTEQAPEHRPPRTPTEIAVAEIWAEILDVEVSSVHDDFFELGGRSLAAMQIVLRIDDEFDV